MKVALPAESGNKCGRCCVLAKRNNEFGKVDALIIVGKVFYVYAKFFRSFSGL
jgi:hypothetical protein